MSSLKSNIIKVKRALSSFILRGDKYYCPLCNGSFRKFMRYGAMNIRENACCPGCGSLERHRLLWLILKKMWDKNQLSSAGKLLHVAPEQVFYDKLSKMFDYISIDLDGNNAMMAMDITSLKFPDEEFDVIICNHVLEHVPDDNKALSELYRVMRYGGWGSIQVPMKGDVTDEDLTVVDPGERERRYGQNDHVRQYGLDYIERLKKAGFKTEVINNYQFLTENDLNKISVSTDEMVILVRK